MLVKYNAFFRIYSEYENAEENIYSDLNIEINAESIVDLQDQLKKIEDDMEWDDSDVINYSAESDLICTTCELLKLIDENNTEINL
jgi:hypothetical protein